MILSYDSYYWKAKAFGPWGGTEYSRPFSFGIKRTTLPREVSLNVLTIVPVKELQFVDDIKGEYLLLEVRHVAENGNEFLSRPDTSLKTIFSTLEIGEKYDFRATNGTAVIDACR